jgi:Tol biopolymer transport system component
VISPDGRQVVFSAQNSSGRSALWLRSLDGLTSRELPGTQGGVFPFWSPDSQAIGYFTAIGPASEGKLMLLNLAGGLPRTLASMRTARGGTWTAAGGAGGTIVFSPSVTGGLMRISAQGGVMTPAVPFNAAQFDSYRFPSFLPDGKHFLFLAINHADSAQDMLYLAALDGGPPKPLIRSLSAGIFAAGQLLYSSGRSLMAQPLDPTTGKLSGSAQPVAQDVFEDSVTWRAAYSASRTGVLVYAGGDTGAQQLAWADRSGHLSPPLPTYSGEAFTAAVAPDGRQFAVSLDQGLQDIWVERTPGSAFDRLTFGPVANLYPTWSPDGKWIAYTGGEGALVQRRPAAGGPEQTIGRAPHADDFLYPVGWSQDDRELVCNLYPAQGAKAVVAITLAGGGLHTLATLGGQDLAAAALSPDNRWVSYLAGEQGQPLNVYVVPFRGGTGAVWQATTTGVVQQFWTQGGRELDVVDNADHLLAIPVSTGADGTPVFGSPQVLADNFPAALAAAGDGQRFLVTTYPHDHQKLLVVNGWTTGH